MIYYITHFPITTFLLACNLVLSLYAWSTPERMNELKFNVGRVASFKEYYRLLTSAFIHVDPFHFMFNMFALHSFGPLLEMRLGVLGYLVLYFGSLFAADWFTLQMKRNEPQYSAVGASGAISGVIFGFILFAPLAKLYILFIPFGVPAFLFGGVYLAITIYLMDSATRERRSMVAHEAHLAGAVAGILITGIIAPDSVRIFLSYFV